MKPEMKLLLALQQIDNLAELLNGNEYEKYLDYLLIQIQVELQRQLTILTHSPKIKK